MNVPNKVYALRSRLDYLTAWLAQNGDDAPAYWHRYHEAKGLVLALSLIETSRLSESRCIAMKGKWCSSFASMFDAGVCA